MRYPKVSSLLRCLAGATAVGGLSAAALAGIERADSNCDTVVNFDDINCFVTAVISQAAWDACGHGVGCTYLQVNDINGDSLVNFDDITPFVQCVVSGGCPSVGTVVDTEIAGNPLATYPFFHYITAIQNNQPVRVALDPTRFPQIVGVTARVYVVANKTETQWNSDPSLTDVTTGGFATVNLVGGTIQANTFTVANAGELSSAAGVGLGVAYDVVVDLNSNGTLDAGDLIDGRRGTEGGFYYMKDITLNGSRPITAANYLVNATDGQPAGQSIPSTACGGTGSSCLSERVFYPTDISAGESLPLVVISHGNGQHFAWYDYIGSHLASHGFIVMSHANNTTPGSSAAALTTLQHVDAFLAQQDTIPQLAAVNGRIDGTNQCWIGHSRGGDGVATAYDALFDGTVRTQFVRAHVKWVSSIAPVDFQGTAGSNPQDVNYHLIYGSADGDVTGGVTSDTGAGFNLFERARSNRTSTYVHGADHNYFNCCGFRDWAGSPGPDITRPLAQAVAKGAFVTNIQHYIRGDVPSRDYFWRQYEDLRPIGVPATVPAGQPLVVVNEYKISTLLPGAQRVAIEDYQTQSSTGVSSSGGAVTSNVTLLTELLMRDVDRSFTYSATDRGQGFARARTTDSSRCATFECPAGSNVFIEYAVVPALQNFTTYNFLSLRACQISRAPLTVAALGDVTFNVTLRDTSGNTSTINIGAYAGGIEEVYQRGGGWQNEMETIRFRITDFKNNGSPLNLSSIAAVRLDFGPAHGSNGCHLGLDDIELTVN